MNHLLRALAASTLLGVAAAASAATEPEAFLRILVDAINSKSADKRLELVHPDSLNCATPGQRQHLEEVFARQSRFPIPGTVNWRLSGARPGRPMFSDRFDYPIRPTHIMQLDVKGDNNETMYVVLQLARRNGQWQEIVGCPKAEAIAVDRRVAIAKAGADEKAQLLVNTMSPTIKAGLVELIKQGRRTDAVRAYRDASAQDEATARAVIEQLATQAGG